jgi:DHA1 family bicyclomycin/chloramphenicol resistance-like MFS transporter
MSKNGYRTLLYSSYLLFALGPLVGNAILVLQELMAVDFGVQPSEVLLSLTFFTIPFAIVQLFSGAISDIRGRISVITLGIILFDFGMFLTIVAPSFVVFLLANSVAGLGYGFVNPVLIALITDSARKEQIPKRMALVGSIGAVSVGLGPGIAGQLASFGWRTFYIIFLLLTILVLGVLRMSKRPDLEMTGRPLREFVSILKMEVRRLPVILMMLGSAFLSLTYSATLVWTSNAFSGNISEGTSGLILMLTGLMGFFAGLVVIVIMKRFGTKVTLILGFVLMITSIFSLFVIGDVANLANITYVAIALFMAGWGSATILPVLTTFSQTLSPKRRGSLAGALTFSQFVAYSAVPVVYAQLIPFGMQMVYIAILWAAILWMNIMFMLNSLASGTISREEET